MVNQMWINHLMQRNVISHMTGKKCDKMVSSREISGPKVIKLFFMLNSGEHEIYPAHEC